MYPLVPSFLRVGFDFIAEFRTMPFFAFHHRHLNWIRLDLSNESVHAKVTKGSSRLPRWEAHGSILEDGIQRGGKVDCQDVPRYMYRYM